MIMSIYYEITTMTLVPFSPAELDALAWRFFDLAATVRKLAASTRAEQLDDVQLHGQKLEVWLTHLEAWAHDARARLDQAQHRAAGARRAAALTEPATTVKPRRRERSRPDKR